MYLLTLLLYIVRTNAYYFCKEIGLVPVWYENPYGEL